MKRGYLIIFLLLLIVIVGYIGVSRLADFAANHLSQKLQVTVSVDSMGLRTKKIIVHNLQIGNPSGYSLAKAFSAKKINIEVHPTELFSDHVVVEEIVASDVDLGLEFDSKTSGKGNWTVIMSNFKNQLQNEPEHPKKRSVLIKRIVFTNINTQLLFHGEGNVHQLPTIDRMEFTNISSNDGLPIDQLTESVLGQMLIEIFRQHHLENMLDSIFLSPENAAKTLFKPVEKLISP